MLCVCVFRCEPLNQCQIFDAKTSKWEREHITQKLTHLMPLFLSLRSPTEFIRLDGTKLHLANSLMVWLSILVENTHSRSLTQTNKFRIVTFMRVPNYTLAKWHSLVCSFSFVHLFNSVCVRVFVCAYALLCLLSTCEHFWRAHCIQYSQLCV